MGFAERALQSTYGTQTRTIKILEPAGDVDGLVAGWKPGRTSVASSSRCVEPSIEVDIPPEQVVVDPGVGRVGRDDPFDGDHRARGRVEVGIDPGGDGRGHGRAQRAG